MYVCLYLSFRTYLSNLFEICHKPHVVFKIFVYL